MGDNNKYRTLIKRTNVAAVGIQMAFDDEFNLEEKAVYYILSCLPETWNLTIQGVMTITGLSKHKAADTLNKFRKYGYLHTKKQSDGSVLSTINMVRPLSEEEKKADSSAKVLMNSGQNTPDAQKKENENQNKTAKPVNQEQPKKAPENEKKEETGIQESKQKEKTDIQKEAQRNEKNVSNEAKEKTPETPKKEDRKEEVKNQQAEKPKKNDKAEPNEKEVEKPKNNNSKHETQTAKPKQNAESLSEVKIENVIKNQEDKEESKPQVENKIEITQEEKKESVKEEPKAEMTKEISPIIQSEGIEVIDARTKPVEEVKEPGAKLVETVAEVASQKEEDSEPDVKVIPKLDEMNISNASAEEDVLENEYSADYEVETEEELENASPSLVSVLMNELKRERGELDDEEVVDNREQASFVEQELRNREQAGNGVNTPVLAEGRFDNTGYVDSQNREVDIDSEGFDGEAVSVEQEPVLENKPLPFGVKQPKIKEDIKIKSSKEQKINSIYAKLLGK